MRIGAALFLIAVGAILTFAVHEHVRHVNLGVVGVALMIVGALGLVVEAAVGTSRRRSQLVVHDVVHHDPMNPPVQRY